MSFSILPGWSKNIVRHPVVMALFIMGLLVVLTSAALAISMSNPVSQDITQIDNTSPVEINGDEVEFTMANKQVVAKGHVVVKKGDVTLRCDRLEFYRESKRAVAEGNVVLERPGGRLTGERMDFNFETMTGGFTDGGIAFHPFYGAGERTAKVGDNHLVTERGYFTTCDHDRPHFRIVSRRVDIYPGDKAVARNVRLVVGKVPIAYLPRFTLDLREGKPAVTYTPGYSKDWGAFLLSKWRWKLNEYIRGNINVDYRERRGVGSGMDMFYKTPAQGSGLVRLYYTQDRYMGKKYHFWDRPSPGPEYEHERFKAEWRHKWNIDPSTRVIWQYYKLSDQEFLKDYFRREYNEDQSPSTYFLLTRNLPSGVLSFRTDVRVNRFESAVERLPEIAYDVADQEVADSGFYLKNNAVYSNLTKRNPSPTDVRLRTMRLDDDARVSYPTKVGFVEFKPYAGMRQTFYTRPMNREDDNSLRGIFNSGSDLSTKFYRIYDVQSNQWGLNINNLRHVLTPTIEYFYQHEPTYMSSKLDQYDEVDSLNQEHVINFGLENKLQTKREKKSVDLARMLLGSDFRLKEDPAKSGFNNFTSDLELTPYNWWRFDADSSYDLQEDRLDSVNFDFTLNSNSDRWYWRLGKRYQYSVDDQFTSEWGWKINQKWKFKVFDRFDADRGKLKEQDYILRRDMHEWMMDINFNQTTGEGSEILLVFTLKAVPDIGFNFGSSYNQRKPGTQSTEP